MSKYKKLNKLLNQFRTKNLKKRKFILKKYLWMNSEMNFLSTSLQQILLKKCQENKTKIQRRSLSKTLSKCKVNNNRIREKTKYSLKFIDFISKFDK